jgi:predicted transcriptional regulator of viral defense system
MNQKLAGIGKKERSSLAILLKSGMAVFTPKTTAKTLKLNQVQAAQLLSRWAVKGWLSRVKHGVYIPVSLQADNPNVMADEPWVIAKALFAPCYIGGWSAAEHWGLTEQIFSSAMVFTTKKAKSREQNLNGVKLTVKTIKPERIFGTKTVWQQNQKVEVSDPTRTVVDAFNDPAVVGGIRMAVDILERYLKSEHKNLKLLIEYTSKMKNTAICKRLGFILELNFSNEVELINFMKKNIKAGYSQLDPSTPGKILITQWNLWIPSKLWEKGINTHDQY